MDHLPKVQKPRHRFPRVPVWILPGLDSERMKFNDFPKHLAQLRPLVPDRPQDIERVNSSFLQSWLFFGLLREFFAVWDVPAKKRFSRYDFITKHEGQEYADTSNLNDYIVALVCREQRDYGNLMTEQKVYARYKSGSQRAEILKARLINAQGLLEMAHTTLLRYQHNPELIDARIWDSVLLVVATLSRANDKIFLPIRTYAYDVLPLDFSDFRLRSIPDMRLAVEHWCTHEARLVSAMVAGSPLEIAFFSQLDMKFDMTMHKRCYLYSRCMAYNVELETEYKAQHAEDSCMGDNCAIIGVRPDSEHQQNRQDQTNKILSGLKKFLAHTKIYLQGPVDAWTYRDGALQTRQMSSRKSRFSRNTGLRANGWNLVAISHVWSHGLGNKTANSLPACQLQRLQDLANSLYPKANRRYDVPFWIDTLGIPVTREEKKKALQNMESIYKRASKILVLDADLTTCDSSEMGPEEIGARIMCSVWSRRLWTFQEGCYRDKVAFKFQDQIWTWPKLHAQVLKGTKLTTWGSQSLLHKKHPVRKQQSVSLVVFNNVPTAKRAVKGTLVFGTRLLLIIAALGIVQYCPWFPVWARLDPWRFLFPDGYRGITMTYPWFAAVRGMNGRLFRAVNPVWDSVFSFMEEFTVTWRSSYQNLKVSALTRCMRAMFYRDCTNHADEVLVLKSVLSGLKGRYIKLPAATPEERYRVLFRMFKRVPHELLFVDQDRYKEPGDGWIPKSLLHANSPAMTLHRRTDALPWWNLLENTLSHAWRLHSATVYKDGVKVRLDGLRFDGPDLPTTFDIEHNWGDKTRETTRWRVTLRKAGGRGHLTMAAAVNGFVLVPERDFARSPARCQAVLVAATDPIVKPTWKTIRSQPVKTEFRALALIEKVYAFPQPESALIVKHDFNKVRGLRKYWHIQMNLAVETGRRTNDKWIIG